MHQKTPTFSHEQKRKDKSLALTFVGLSYKTKSFTAYRDLRSNCRKALMFFVSDKYYYTPSFTRCLKSSEEAFIISEPTRLRLFCDHSLNFLAQLLHFSAKLRPHPMFGINTVAAAGGRSYM